MNRALDTPAVEGLARLVKSTVENSRIKSLGEDKHQVIYDLTNLLGAKHWTEVERAINWSPASGAAFAIRWSEGRNTADRVEKESSRRFPGMRAIDLGRGFFEWRYLDEEEVAANELADFSQGLVERVAPLPRMPAEAMLVPRHVALDGTSLATYIAWQTGSEDNVAFHVEPSQEPHLFRVEYGAAVNRPLYVNAHQYFVTTGKGVARSLSVLERYANEFDSGRTIVEYDEIRNTVVAAHLDPMTRKARGMLAKRLGCATWDLSVRLSYRSKDGVGRLESLQAASARVTGKDSEARLAKWRDCADILPGPSRAYKVTEDESGTVTFSYFDDALKRLVNYDWSAEFSLARVPFAIDENGALISMALIESNILLGGIPGGGKSGGSTALIAGMSQIEHVALIGLDPKMVELLPWRDRFSIVATDDDHASFVLAALLGEMDRRYVWLSENYDRTKAKKFSESMINLEHPLLVVVIDELAELVSGGSTKLEVDEQKFRASAIRRLIAKGRAAGIVVDTATQKPGSDIIPTSLRDLIAQRIAYSTSNPQMTETILGQGSASSGGLAHTIAASEKGVCYIINEGSREPVRARTFWVPDEDIPDLVTKTKHLKVALPWLPTEAEAKTEVAAAGGKPVEWVSVIPDANRGGGNQVAVLGRQLLPKPDPSVFALWDSQFTSFGGAAKTRAPATSPPKPLI
ncbi:FtsK/SpoIIIE domain-containing protein, partial [Frigoribacterium sp. 9N]|uniref:FtsK/SpoIIIE domain-containing protein n=1 Tax=Frigoribacterium sp. 9N TaxID=2653144 RepID=UPI00210664A2